MTVWHLLTGEYPPQPGGVSDYTAQLAVGLVACGVAVHVWAPPASDPTAALEGVTVHRAAGRWSPAGLARIDRELDDFPPPRRLLAQHTPNSWGFKGLNLGFGRWLVRRRTAGDDVRVMFHEVRYYPGLRDKPTRWLLAAGQRAMVKDLLDASSVVYMSTPSWEPRLRAHDRGRDRALVWLPIPSTIPEVDDASGVAALRRRLAPRGETLIGSFGTFSGAIADMLAATLTTLLGNRPDRRCVLIGRGGDRFAERSGAALSGPLVATGELPADAVSRHLQACDLLIQPYPDGVTSRRTSIMAGLAHGRAVATNQGWLTEPFWAETGGVALAPSIESDALIAVAECLLNEPEARARLGAAARSTYQQWFAIDRTVATLLQGNSR